MKNSVFIAVAFVFMLTACASGRFSVEGFSAYNGLFVKKPNPNNPNVFVNDDTYIIVDQEPIHLRIKSNKRPVIVWALDNNTTYVFANPAISSFTPVGSSPPLTNVDCPMQGSGSGPGQQFLVCAYDAPATGKYTYTLRIINSKGNVIVSDPSIMND
jgi:hypothetical protein